MAAFLRRHGVQVAWIEVRERPRAEGEHVHLAIFVPLRLQSLFAEQMLHWVEMDADWVEARAVDVRRVGPRWWDRRDYMLKGGDPEVRSRFRCWRWSASQGVLIGPRVRVAHSIGRTARKAAEARGAALQALLDETAGRLAGKWELR
jgi:hypothetical protein